MNNRPGSTSSSYSSSPVAPKPTDSESPSNRYELKQTSQTLYFTYIIHVAE